MTNTEGARNIHDIVNEVLARWGDSGETPTQAHRHEIEDTVTALADDDPTETYDLSNLTDDQCETLVAAYLALVEHDWARLEPTGGAADHGTLTDYTTGEDIRPATADELAQSIESEQSGKHGCTGAFDLDGRTVYVAGGQ